MTKCDMKQKESDESKQCCTFGMKTKWSPLLTFCESDHSCIIWFLHSDCDYHLIKLDNIQAYAIMKNKTNKHVNYRHIALPFMEIYTDFLWNKIMGKK